METINGLKSTFFGINKKTKKNIYIYKPTWDCNWYWGFGYLGNRNLHYHLSSYQNGRNINMHDALLNDYDLAINIKNNLWEFCELALTAYALKETAEVLGRGGSHMSTNPLADIIKNADEVKRINEVVLPKIFNRLNEIYTEKDFSKAKLVKVSDAYILENDGEMSKYAKVLDVNSDFVCIEYNNGDFDYVKEKHLTIVG